MTATKSVKAPSTTPLLKCSSPSPKKTASPKENKFCNSFTYSAVINSTIPPPPTISEPPALALETSTILHEMPPAHLLPIPTHFKTASSKTPRKDSVLVKEEKKCKSQDLSYQLKKIKILVLTVILYPRCCKKRHLDSVLS